MTHILTALKYASDRYTKEKKEAYTGISFFSKENNLSTASKRLVHKSKSHAMFVVLYS